MCIDGRRTLVTVISVSKVSREGSSQDYPERAVQYDGNRQPMPAAPQDGQWDRDREDVRSDRNNDRNRDDARSDRTSPPPVPQPTDGAVQQAPAGSQPNATAKSTTPSGPADGSYEGAADRNAGRIEATNIRD
jgi:hypothetical protein